MKTFLNFQIALHEDDELTCAQISSENQTNAFSRLQGTLMSTSTDDLEFERLIKYWNMERYLDQFKSCLLIYINLKTK